MQDHTVFISFICAKFGRYWFIAPILMARVPSIQRVNHKYDAALCFFYEKYERGKKGDKDVHMVVKIENKKENM